MAQTEGEGFAVTFLVGLLALVALLFVGAWVVSLTELEDPLCESYIPEAEEPCDKSTFMEGGHCACIRRYHFWR